MQLFLASYELRSTSEVRGINNMYIYMHFSIPFLSIIPVLIIFGIWFLKPGYCVYCATHNYELYPYGQTMNRKGGGGGQWTIYYIILK